jgi:hypothetical protein
MGPSALQTAGRASFHRDWIAIGRHSFSTDLWTWSEEKLRWLTPMLQPMKLIG